MRIRRDTTELRFVQRCTFCKMNSEHSKMSIYDIFPCIHHNENIKSDKKNLKGLKIRR